MRETSECRALRKIINSRGGNALIGPRDVYDAAHRMVEIHDRERGESWHINTMDPAKLSSLTRNRKDDFQKYVQEKIALNRVNWSDRRSTSSPASTEFSNHRSLPSIHFPMFNLDGSNRTVQDCIASKLAMRPGYKAILEELDEETKQTMAHSRSFSQLLENFKAGKLPNGGYTAEDKANPRRERMKQRKRQRVRKMKLLEEAALHGANYGDSSMLPGLNFWQHVYTEQTTSEKELSFEPVRVPYTLVLGFGTDGCNGVEFRNSSHGKPKKSEHGNETRRRQLIASDVCDEHFRKSLLEVCNTGSENSPNRNGLPLFVLKTDRGEDKGTTVKFIHTHDELDRILDQLPQMVQSGGAVVALQRYVKASGPKPWMVRLAKPKHGMPKVYIITSDLPYPSSQLELAEETRYSVSTPTRVSERSDACQAVRSASHSSALEQPKRMLGTLLHSIRERCKVDLETVVADFIRDELGQWWMLQVKAFDGMTQVPAHPIKKPKQHSDTESTRRKVDKQEEDCVGDFCHVKPPRGYNVNGSRSIKFKTILSERLVSSEGQQQISKEDRKLLFEDVIVCKACFRVYEMKTKDGKQRHERSSSDSSSRPRPLQFTQPRPRSMPLPAADSLSTQAPMDKAQLELAARANQVQHHRYDVSSAVLSKKLFDANRALYKGMIRKQKEWIDRNSTSKASSLSE